VNNKKTQLIVFSSLLAVYIVIVGVLVYHIYNLPNFYIQRETQNVETIQTTLKEILETEKNPQTLKTSLDELVFSHAMELMLYKDDKVIYTTMPNIEIHNIRDIFHEEATAYKSQGVYQTPQGEYYVLYNIYPISSATYINQNFSQLTKIVFVLIALLFIILVLLYFTLLAPLKSVRKALTKMKKYNFSEIVEPDARNVITKDLNLFAQSIDAKIKATSKNYSELEIALQFERERLTIMMSIIRAYVHNLKSPTHQLLLGNEARGEKDKNIQPLAQYNIDNLELLLTDINEILILMDTDISDIEKQVEQFDFMEEVTQTLHLFEGYLNQNELGFFTEAPEHLDVTMNKVILQIILHNLFSNATKYATKGTEIEFSVHTDETNDYLMLEITNEATKHDIQRILSSENLFNVIEEVTNPNDIHRYSTGNGLYLLKEVIHLLNGEYELLTTDTIVTIYAKLKIDN